MSDMKKFAKKYAASKLISFLSTDFRDMPIYRAGIVDGRGRLLVDLKKMTSKQKSMFGPFEQLLTRVKRTLLSHGIHNVALAVTYLEEDDEDQFWNIVQTCTEDGEGGFSGGTPTSNVDGTSPPLFRKKEEKK